MRARRGGNILAAALAAVLATAVVALTPLSILGPLSIDVLFWLRARVTAAPASPSAVAIIAIDEETYRRAPFSGTPSALWTPELARIVDAVRGAGAKVIGLDVIFPTTGQRLGAGFDRPWLEALSAAAKENKIVLGKVQHGAKPILPHPAQQIAAGGERNLRAVNLASDTDDVVRRVPYYFATATGPAEPSFALELAARALGVEPRIREGRVRLGTNVLPGRSAGGLLVNFDAGGARPLVYSFADLATCAGADRPAAATDYFGRHFAGKVVLIGAVLDVEDRRLTSFRFATRAEEALPAPRCTLPRMAELVGTGAARDTVPGVFVLAAAIDNMLRGTALEPLGPGAVLALVAALALLAAFAGALLRPALSIPAAALLAAAVAGAAILLFVNAHTVLPLLQGGVAATLALVLAGGYRQFVAGRDRARLRKSFELYLPREVVARMIAEGRLPALGGEEREVSIFFADLAGFTARAERLTPQQTVELVNRYFAIVAEEIERQGGVVERFIGDAVLAVFGAPLALPDHAARAVEAALACRSRLQQFNAEEPTLRADPLRQRIGINTGRVVVGNIGSPRRLSYTVMGDAVNLAHRIEEANRGYGTDILASGTTVQQSGDRIEWRAIAVASVRGRRDPVDLFAPLASKGTERKGDRNVSAREG